MRGRTPTHSGEQVVGLFAHTWDRDWQASKTECSRAGARAVRPLLGTLRF